MSSVLGTPNPIRGLDVTAYGGIVDRFKQSTLESVRNNSGAQYICYPVRLGSLQGYAGPHTSDAAVREERLQDDRGMLTWHQGWGKVRLDRAELVFCIVY